MAQLPPSGRSPEAPKKRNVGGRARKITMTMQDWWDEKLDARSDGFEEGVEHATRELRDKIRDELQGELEAFDPDCPLCTATREIRDLHAQLRAMKINLDESRQRARGRAIREGRYPYRET